MPEIGFWGNRNQPTNGFKAQSIQSLVLESYRTGLGLLWASLNQPKQKKYIKN